MSVSAFTSNYSDANWRKRRGYDALVLLQIKEALLAQESDIYDVLAHVAYSRNMLTREHRAEVGRRRIDGQYDTKIATFLDYVLGHYVENGVEDLDRSKLPDYLKLKFGTFSEGANELGGIESVVSSFVGFQRHLYSPSN